MYTNADGTYPFSLKIPEGDTRERLACDTCGWINYVNPKIVVGAVCTWQERFLLCRRAINPRKGFWTLPAGFLEEQESAEAGAKREAMEEAGAEIEILGLLGAYSVPRISQVQLMYKARLVHPNVVAGEESLEVRLFDWADIPWDEISFPSVRWALDHYRETGDRAEFAARSNPPGEAG